MTKYLHYKDVTDGMIYDYLNSFGNHQCIFREAPTIKVCRDKYEVAQVERNNRNAEHGAICSIRNSMEQFAKKHGYSGLNVEDNDMNNFLYGRSREIAKEGKILRICNDCGFPVVVPGIDYRTQTFKSYGTKK